ncbi:methyltransferase domain-containing protein [Marivita sp. GX14005]|uniref:class I SAM-dependent methyltransferase n=1 Tax=Marivita sp. GX14005 TaxID=2942276 RepID=UPI002019746F|nr:methyltransferase domain-containing protein [Marivita sp. GX14005]MCL3882144.1 methyltransferase domain-containing protein [Marivita sp. GX14005]
MRDSAAFWDRVADRYARMPVRDPVGYRETLDHLRGYLEPDHRMLELGCGTGSTAVALAGDVAHITASDISGAMLEKGREKAVAARIGNVDFVQADAVEAPRGPFDIVTAFNLLHLIEDRDAALRAIAERTKPGGLFISKTFCLPRRRGLVWLALYTVLPMLQAIGKAPYFARLTQEELLAAIEGAGFATVETRQASGRDPRLTIVARRNG